MNAGEGKGLEEGGLRIKMMDGRVFEGTVKNDKAPIGSVIRGLLADDTAFEVVSNGKTIDAQTPLGDFPKGEITELEVAEDLTPAA